MQRVRNTLIVDCGSTFLNSNQFLDWNDRYSECIDLCITDETIKYTHLVQNHLEYMRFDLLLLILALWIYYLSGWRDCWNVGGRTTTEIDRQFDTRRHQLFHETYHFLIHFSAFSIMKVIQLFIGRNLNYSLRKMFNSWLENICSNRKVKIFFTLQSHKIILNYIFLLYYWKSANSVSNMGDGKKCVKNIFNFIVDIYFLI